MKLFECGTFIDGTGNDPINDARLLVEDSRVVAAGPTEEIDEPNGDVQHVDYRDKTVLPGLIDAHLHLQGKRSMSHSFDPIYYRDALAAARATADCKALLEAGFTTVRDLGSTTGLGLRDAIATGEIPGPRVYTSGRGLSQTAGHGDVHEFPYSWVSQDRGPTVLVDGVAECRRETRKKVREGSDCLKISTTGGIFSANDNPHQQQFTDAEIRAMVEEAHRAGLVVASHAQGTAGIIAALEAGVDTIEHAIFLDEDAIDLLCETDATIVPTLSIMDRIVTAGSDHDLHPHLVRMADSMFDSHMTSIKRAYEAGVPIAAGTDYLGSALLPHGENAHELFLLVDRIGMSEQEAITAATGGGSRTIPDDDVGHLADGARADLVVADDPLSDIRTLDDPVAVYKGGKRVV